MLLYVLMYNRVLDWQQQWNGPEKDVDHREMVQTVDSVFGAQKTARTKTVVSSFRPASSPATFVEPPRQRTSSFADFEDDQIEREETKPLVADDDAQTRRRNAQNQPPFAAEETRQIETQMSQRDQTQTGLPPRGETANESRGPKKTQRSFVTNKSERNEFPREKPTIVAPSIDATSTTTSINFARSHQTSAVSQKIHPLRKKIHVARDSDLLRKFYKEFLQSNPRYNQTWKFCRNNRNVRFDRLRLLPINDLTVKGLMQRMSYCDDDPCNDDPCNEKEARCKSWRTCPESESEISKKFTFVFLCWYVVRLLFCLQNCPKRISCARSAFCAF